MNIVENKFERRYRRLLSRNNIPVNSVHVPCFHSIIGLDKIPLGEYNIQLTRRDSYCILHIHYKHTQYDFDLVSNNIRELPPEINRLISEYLPSYITLELRMDYTDYYPFDSPVWRLIKCDDHLASSLKNSEEYYKYIITNHNQANLANWNPAIDIDKDILGLMTRIHHFDSLFL